MAFAQFRCRVIAQNRPPVVTDFPSRLRIVFWSSSQANMLGRYNFQLPDIVRTGSFRPLRTPGSPW